MKSPFGGIFKKWFHNGSRKQAARIRLVVAARAQEERQRLEYRPSRVLAERCLTEEEHEEQAARLLLQWYDPVADNPQGAEQAVGESQLRPRNLYPR